MLNPLLGVLLYGAAVAGTWRVCRDRQDAYPPVGAFWRGGARLDSI